MKPDFKNNQFHFYIINAFFIFFTSHPNRKSRGTKGVKDEIQIHYELRSGISMILTIVLLSSYFRTIFTRNEYWSFDPNR